MSKEGRKIEEFRIYTNDSDRPAVLRMTERFKFTLEVDDLKFEGDNPKELIRQAEISLAGESGATWEPIILVDPDLDDLRLSFIRLFHGKNSKGKDIYRQWAFNGVDERARHTWDEDDEVDTFQMTEGASPGTRSKGPCLKDRELPYTPERWLALVKLDEMLRDTMSAISEKLREIIRDGDVDKFLANIRERGPQAILFDEKTKQ